MKAFFFLLFGCLLAVQCDAQSPVADQQFRARKNKLYTTLDRVVISTQNRDTLVFTKKEFNQIIDSFPSLYDEGYISDPDINYSSVNRKNMFVSEVGQDTYYILYAFFLRQNLDVKYAPRRKTLTQIYDSINSIFSRLQGGGTFFGHQYRRIIAYAEYSVYWYSKRPDFFDKWYAISEQKELYLRSLHQLVKDELSKNPARVHIEQQLHNTINDLGKLITDGFYLKRAQAFQYAYY
jgi:hypothetical protein